MDKKLRVCMVSSQLYPTYAGGALQALRLSRALRSKGAEVTIFTRNTGAFPKKEYLGDIPLYQIPTPGSSKLSAVIFFFSIFFFLLRNRCHIIHIHGVDTYTYTAILVARLLRRKSIVKMTLLDQDDPLSVKKRRPLGNLQYKIFTMADRIIATSSELAAAYRQSPLPVDKLVEIPNSVNTEDFRPVSEGEKLSFRQQLGLPADSPVIAFVGIILKRKGVDLLVKAHGELVGEHPSARLILIGPLEGHGRNTDMLAFQEGLRRDIKTLGIEGRVTFVGRVENVSQHLQASDVFAFPSRKEGMPNAVLEAMACGLPCVAMESSCVSSIISNGVNGLLFERENSHQLAQHISRLLAEPELRRKLGGEARKTAVNKFSVEIISNRYLELYHELLDAII